ncbi:MAG: hypothetical protein AAFZ15_34570 [Bacteroidota bacterium]
MKSGLNNFYWRYKSGYLSGDKLDYLIKEKINDLFNFTKKYDSSRPLIREFKLEHIIIEYFNLADKADALRYDRRYKLSIQKIESAISKAIEIKRLLKVINQYEYSKNLYEVLTRDLAGTELMELPVFNIFYKLLDGCKSKIENQKYRQAEFLIRLCIGKMQIIRQNDSVDKQKQNKYRKRLNQLNSVCSETVMYARVLNDNLDTNGKITGILNGLIKNHHYLLAERLLQELEIKLSGRISFWKELELWTKDKKNNDMQALQLFEKRLLQSLKGGSWKIGTSFIIQQSLITIQKELDDFRSNFKSDKW